MPSRENSALRCCFRSYLREWSMDFICWFQSWQRKRSSWWPLPSVRVTAWILGSARDHLSGSTLFSSLVSWLLVILRELSYFCELLNNFCHCRVMFSAVSAVFVSPDCALDDHKTKKLVVFSRGDWFFRPRKGYGWWILLMGWVLLNIYTNLPSNLGLACGAISFIYIFSIGDTPSKI